MPIQDPSVITRRRTTLGHFVDAANLLTLSGLASSIAAITFALNAEYAAAGISLVLAIGFDNIDGPVAKRTHGRTDDDRAFGANLDTVADMVTAGVALGVVLLSYGGFGVAYYPGALVLGVAVAMRLSYFSVHGLDEASPTYTGLPADLAVLAFAATMLLDGPMPLGAFRALLYGVAVVLAALMVSPLRVRKLTGRWYYALTTVAVALATAHAARILL
ncbi:MAG: CDP-alcohol phosphatidyltransferase family protein [Acidobacteria bacterium]|nr:CDP-alcohol phosphatidyltransferase family protein [Acidobacteriota bacterium]